MQFKTLQKDLDTVPWHVLEIFDDIEDRWFLWKHIYVSILDEHAPLRAMKKRRKQVPWITEEVREIMRVRNSLWKKARKTKDEQTWLEFRLARNYVTAEMRRCKRAYLEDVIKSTRKQPRRLWSELNRVMGRHTQSTVQHIQTDEGDLYDNQGIAMAFNEHFITQIQQMVDDTSASTNTSTGAYSSALSEPLNVPHFTFSPVNSSVVCNLLNCLDVRKAAGCDGIQMWLMPLAS